MDRVTLTRRDLLHHRFVRHQLHLEPASLRRAADVDLLDLGVQDTGPDGHRWALAVRGAPEPAEDELALAWTLRGAPHAYRRADLPAVAVATAPFSEADAAKRIFDAAKPLRAAGLDLLDALATVAREERRIVTKATVKGELSTRLTARLDDPFLRECRPCKAIHSYEQPFRLAALQAGLELEPGTSPPVLRRIPGLDPPLYRRSGAEADPRVHVVRTHLRFAPGVRLRDVVTAVDGASKDLTAARPEHVVEVAVKGESAGRAGPRLALAEDAAWLAAPVDVPRAVRLVGPYDPYLQLQDRELLVPDEAGRKDLWRILGRPGAVVADGDVVGTWRAATKGRNLTVTVEPWGKLSKADRALVEAEAARLADHRGLALHELRLA